MKVEIYNQLLRQVERHEGKRLKPYRCTAGYLTIGVGRNLDAKGITEEECDMMLIHDLKEAQKQAESLDYFHSLSDIRKCVIVNMVFNMGLYGVTRFRNMAQAIRLKDYSLAAEEMLDSKWARQVGDRAQELAFQMKYGLWRPHNA